MRATLRILGSVCVVQAVGGVISELGGPGSLGREWFLVHRVGLLEGYEIFACIVLGVLGPALWAAGAAVRDE
ncbi:hypothetical protein ACFYY8_32845 [Streptosporangium sp. NPDC001559]|uniref:hypothetical protein n=1 Tax=Streptosporangium sp. NPDC001559 TaxID=3366187 RepID=UPI0036E1BDF5